MIMTNDNNDNDNKPSIIHNHHEKNLAEENEKKKVKLIEREGKEINDRHDGGLLGINVTKNEWRE